MLIHVCRSDARLHKDDKDICFSKTLNSCKVPQIRYASVERLLERLTDLRFLSIDFLNTFLHTYRIFTTAAVVMDKLADIYKKPFTSIPVRLEYLSLAVLGDFFLQCKGSVKMIDLIMAFILKCFDCHTPVIIVMSVMHLIWCSLYVYCRSEAWDFYDLFFKKLILLLLQQRCIKQIKKW